MPSSTSPSMHAESSSNTEQQTVGIDQQHHIEGRNYSLLPLFNNNRSNTRFEQNQNDDRYSNNVNQIAIQSSEQL